MTGEATSLFIWGGRMVDPGRAVDRVGDLLITEGLVAEEGEIIGNGLPAAVLSRASQLDARGLVICPGFIDLHCHLREPGFEAKETIATGTRAAARGGFSTVCCMANTEPPLDTPAAIHLVKQRAAREGAVEVLPVGCVTLGRSGLELSDMPALAEAGVVAFSDDGDPVASSHIMRQALTCTRDLGLPVIDHCEDKALSNSGVMNEGRISASAGLRGIPAAAEEVMVARDLALQKLTGGRLHIAHVSTRGSVELVRRAKEDGAPVTAEATPHHLTLTEERVLDGTQSSSFNASAKVNPPLRTEEDVKALVEGLRSGIIDSIATDHAPHDQADKNCGFDRAAFGISGFETAFSCLMDLVHREEISLTLLISRLTRDPARIIGRDGRLGTLRAGVPANIALLDLDREWTVSARDFASKGRNTPYESCTFKGKVVATLVNGRIAYLDESLRGRLTSAPGRSDPTPYHCARGEHPHG